jgi:hypothetical protein
LIPARPFHLTKVSTKIAGGSLSRETLSIGCHSDPLPFKSADRLLDSFVSILSVGPAENHL